MRMGKKIKRFEIIFDERHGVYRAGGPVTGEVILELKKTMKMKQIVLYTSGRAKVQFNEKVRERYQTYKAEEIYFEQNIVLHGGDSATLELQPGVHNFRFTFNLNPRLPSSFEGEFGFVRYLCKAVIVKPWKFNQSVKKPFTVIGHLDLNGEPPALRGPAVGETTRHPIGCCISGEVRATLRINKTLFVPGEYVNVYAVIENNSNAMVNSTRLSLEQVVTYSGQPDGNRTYDIRDKTCHNCLQAKERGRIKPDRTDVWDNIQMIIPALPPSRLLGCDVINISYSINLYANISHVSSNLRLHLVSDLTIGTIPLRESEARPPAGPVVSQPGPSAPVLDYGYGDEMGAIQLDMAEAPPSYEECVSGRVNIRQDDNTDNAQPDINWAPSYPYYPTLPPPKYTEFDELRPQLVS